MCVCVCARMRVHAFVSVCVRARVSLHYCEYVSVCARALAFACLRACAPMYHCE